MNIKQAKRIPITNILIKLGSTVVKEQGDQCWHLSPLRLEKTPSFHVHKEKNIWYDFGEAKGGTAIDLAVAYLQAAGHQSNVSNALQFLSKLVGQTTPQQMRVAWPLINKEDQDKAGWILKSEKPVSHLALARYLKSRGIPLAVANRHLREVSVQNSQTAKTIFALGFKNEDEGWELRNAFFKSAIAPKTITFIRGAEPKPQGVHVFEGVMDFLSILAREKGRRLQNDAIVLNSLSCLSHALPYMQDYGYRMLFSWMDNDVAGDKATLVLAEFVRAENSLTHYAMNAIYEGYKDVSLWHEHNPPAEWKVRP